MNLPENNALAPIWAMYYAGLVAMQMHPKNENFGPGKSIKPTLDFCAEVADAMLDRHTRRFKWPQ